MKDGLHDPLWLLGVLGDTFWINQCIVYLSGLYKQDSGGEAQRLLLLYT